MIAWLSLATGIAPSVLWEQDAVDLVTLDAVIGEANEARARA